MIRGGPGGIVRKMSPEERLRCFTLLLRVTQGLVNDHLEVGLITKATLGCLDAGLGDIVGVQANGGGGSRFWFRKRDSTFGEETFDATTPQSPLLRCFLKFIGDQLPVLIPPFGFFVFICELRKFEIGHCCSALYSRYVSLSRFVGSNAVTTRILSPRRVMTT